jgi:hypothetical protein
VPSTFAEGVRAIIGLNIPNIRYNTFNHRERQNQTMALAKIRSRKGGWHLWERQHLSERQKFTNLSR